MTGMKSVFVLVLISCAAGCGQSSTPPSPVAPSAALSVSSGTLLKGSGGANLTPATGQFRDASTDHVLSDGSAYIDGQNAVSSAINVGGNYLLDTEKTSRKLTFVAPASYAVGGCTLPFQREATPSDFANQGLAHLNTMAVGATAQVTATIVVTPSETPKTQYYLTYEPSVYPETSSITATRVSSTTWTLEAAADAIAKISTATAHGTKPCGDAIGMPFLITVTLQ